MHQLQTVIPLAVMLSGCILGWDPLHHRVDTDDTGSDTDDSGDTGEEPRCPTIAIPSATIILDGMTTDWDGIDAAIEDAQGDDSPSYDGDDLRALYIADGGTDLFLRIDLWEPVNENFRNGDGGTEGRYRVNLPNDGPYVTLDAAVTFHETDGWVLGYTGSGTGSGLQGPEFVGVLGSVIEIGVPHAEIGNPTILREVEALVENCCVQPWTALDVASCVTVEL